MESILNQIPKMMTGNELRDAMTYLPCYDINIMNADSATRLLALSDIYKIYIPTSMSMEIYTKIYLTMVQSLQMKQSKDSIIQMNENHKAMHGAPFVGINGGNSLSIIGTSGLGKSSAIEKSIALAGGYKLINMETQSFHSKVIPVLICQCPHDCSVKSMLLEILRQADSIIGSCYYERAIRAKATIDMLIGSVCQLSVKSIAIIIIDEIQNVVEHKGGNKLMAMLTQLINCGEVSLLMVGTPEIKTFFESDLRLARRSTGLLYERLPYNQIFVDICKTIYNYQYVKFLTELTDGMIYWLYEHSAGIISNIITLIHDAQEIAILNESERLDISTLNVAYSQRMNMLNIHIASFNRKNSQTSRAIKKNIEIQTITNESDMQEEQSVYELIMEARRNYLDSATVLKKAGYIMEIAI